MTATSAGGGPSVEPTSIPGLLVVHLDLRRDERGWFEESWHRAKLAALGVPDLGPVQANVAWSRSRGTTRGLHAEPWDKLVTVVTGRVHGAWLDLREGAGFGQTVSMDLEPGVAVFVPRGVANGYQTLVDETAYSYLINDHWRADADYLAVDVDDPALGITWPVPAPERLVSEKDRRNPALAEVVAVPRARPLVIGADGQAGRAILAAFPGARGVTRAELDLADADAVAAWPWAEHDVVVNAAAFTEVDGAETDVGRRLAWQVDAAGPASLTRAAQAHGFLLVHLSTDYVYDGTEQVHLESEALSPLGGYGAAKAAGDLAVGLLRRHYLVRTSWLVGDGDNFVRTMIRLADDGASPDVVDDQLGRLTFADELAGAVAHLVTSGAPYGTYHVSSSGEPGSWAAIAREVFRLRGRDPESVRPVTSEQHAAGRESVARRPRSSVLSLAALEATGFRPADGMAALRAYVEASTRP